MSPSHKSTQTIRATQGVNPIRDPKIGPCEKVPKIMVFGGFLCFLVFFTDRPKEDKPMGYCAWYSVPICTEWTYLKKSQNPWKSSFLSGFWEVFERFCRINPSIGANAPVPRTLKEHAEKRPLRPHPKKGPKKSPFASFPGCLPTKQGFWTKIMKNGFFGSQTPKSDPRDPKSDPRINSIFNRKHMGKNGKNGIDFYQKSMKNHVFEGFSPGTDRHMHRNGPSIQGIFSQIKKFPLAPRQSPDCREVVIWQILTKSI